MTTVSIIGNGNMGTAIGGIVALIHDLLMALGIFTLFGFEYSVPVVASFLILIGYSMSDTIVIFDRIRENKRIMRRESLEEIARAGISRTATAGSRYRASVASSASRLEIFRALIAAANATALFTSATKVSCAGTGHPQHATRPLASNARL